MTENTIPTRLTAAQARAKAEECRAMAKTALDKSNRIMLNSIARTWDNIAENAAKET